MFDKLWKLALSLLVLTFVVGIIVYFATKEPEREMTPLMDQLATEACQDLARDLPREESIERVLILVKGPQARDEQKQFRDRMIDAVEGSAKYDTSRWEDVKDKVEDEGYIAWFHEKFGDGGIGEAPRDFVVGKKALERLEDANKPHQGIVMLSIDEFDESTSDSGLGAEIEVSAEVYSYADDKVVATVGPINKSIKSEWDLRYMAHVMKERSIILRFLGWFIVVCGFPWVLINLIRGALRRKNNQINGGLLVAFTLWDIALAWPLLFAYSTGGGTIFGLIVIAGMMGYYNYDAIEYIDRKLL